MRKPIRIAARPDKPHGKPPTEAQERQRSRAWHIARIRALWTQASLLSPDRRMAVQAIIDAELREKGAEPHGVRAEREHQELLKRCADENARVGDPIPF